MAAPLELPLAFLPENNHKRQQTHNTMLNATYNTRTLAACAKRLRHIQAKDGHLPQGTVVWRYSEGFRLQLTGEEHEPGGYVQYNASNIERIEEALKQNQADDKARIALGALLESEPHEFTDPQLRYLSMNTDIPSIYAQTAFLALCARNMAKHPDAARRKIA